MFPCESFQGGGGDQNIMSLHRWCAISARHFCIDLSRGWGINLGTFQMWRALTMMFAGCAVAQWSATRYNFSRSELGTRFHIHFSRSDRRVCLNQFLNTKWLLCEIDCAAGSHDTGRNLPADETARLWRQRSDASDQ